jgi:hypothetical protein
LCLVCLFGGAVVQCVGRVGRGVERDEHLACPN